MPSLPRCRARASSRRPPGNGDVVTADDRIAVIEAMKMENPVTAYYGTVWRSVADGRCSGQRWHSHYRDRLTSVGLSSDRPGGQLVMSLLLSRDQAASQKTRA